MRTSDKAFFNCPLCGKPPHIEIYDVGTARVYCKGGIFTHHKIIDGTVYGEQPSKLYKTLSEWWNQMYYVELRFLPIVVRKIK